MIGELDAGNPHVQFDEGAQETCDSVTRLCPTLRICRPGCRFNSLLFHNGCSILQHLAPSSPGRVL